MFYSRVLVTVLLLCIGTTSQAARSYGANSKFASYYIDESSFIVISLAADRTTVAPGESVNLSWATSGTRWCTASGNWSGKQEIQGTYTTAPLQTSSSFTLSCKEKGLTESRTVSIAVVEPQPEPAPDPISEPDPAPEPPPEPDPAPEPDPVPEPTPPPAPELQFSIDQTEVDDGATVLLSWDSANAESCEASGDWSGSRALAGSQQVVVHAYSTFAMSCTNATSTASNMVSVAVRNIDISWQAPTENVDGTALTDLDGFRVYSVNGAEYLLEADITSPSATRVMLAKPSGEYDFVMTAYDTSGDESGYSNSVTKISP